MYQDIPLLSFMVPEYMKHSAVTAFSFSLFLQLSILASFPVYAPLELVLRSLQYQPY
jgi:hypothetical protein